MALDPTKHADWEIAQDAEKDMLTIYEIGEKLGLTKEELLPQGHYIGKIDFRKVLDRLKDKPDGKYIDVTAISPTPLGEGKSTSSMGLVQGLGKIGKSVCAAIRQPSGGPTIRPMVAALSLVCRVEKTRCPVIAALMAISAVS